ncbi:TetR/AcrR family transcriptional regulator [Streptomyces sp. P6-2-1]|uniref:TetR/AcrR family transcriptional regulator n=1 Tax=unclassified Streptomyces TaxID=2593676 RepID=UPI003D364E35
MPRGITAKGLATRHRIVEHAAALVREHGTGGTALEDVRHAAGVSSSQLFHYFPEGKSELLLAVARRAGEQVLLDQEPQLSALADGGSWRAWAERVYAHYEAQGPNCDLSALTAQLGMGDPGIREVVSGMHIRWQAALAAGLRAHQSRGAARQDADPDRAAAALLAAVQGGVLMMASTDSSAHLRAAVETWLDGMGLTAAPPAQAPPHP